MNSLKINVSPTKSEDSVAQQLDNVQLKESITKPRLMGKGPVHINCHAPRNWTQAKGHHQELKCPVFDKPLNQLDLPKKPDNEACYFHYHFCNDTWPFFSLIGK